MKNHENLNRQRHQLRRSKQVPAEPVKVHDFSRGNLLHNLKLLRLIENNLNIMTFDWFTLLSNSGTPGFY